LGEGLVGSMRDAEGDVFNAEALGNLAGFPMQFYGGAPAALAHNLDIDPADASAPSGAFIAASLAAKRPAKRSYLFLKRSQYSRSAGV
jgi:hypothetical protein